MNPELLLPFAVIAVCTGFVKAGVPSLGALLSACVALVFPPREAIGITLMFLLVGDIAAMGLYWRLADWQEVRKMVLPVLCGIAMGGLLLGVLDNQRLGLVIGLLVIVLVSLEPLRPRLTAWAEAHPDKARGGSGLLAGVATTIGNAAGPILSLYFLLLKLDKQAFVGTGAAFFLFVNVSKIPVFLAMDIFQGAYLPTVALTAPLVFLGALGGRCFLVWISQRWFNRLILWCTGLAGIWLVLRYLLTAS